MTVLAPLDGGLVQILEEDDEERRDWLQEQQRIERDMESAGIDDYYSMHEQAPSGLIRIWMRLLLKCREDTEGIIRTKSRKRRGINNDRVREYPM